MLNAAQVHCNQLPAKEWAASAIGLFGQAHGMTVIPGIPALAFYFAMPAYCFPLNKEFSN